MIISKILGGILILLSVLFLGLQFRAYEIEASGIKALGLLLLTVLYVLRVKHKHPLFFAFLIVFTIAEIFNFSTWVVNIDPDPNFDYYYYIGNGIYLLAYTFLIFRILVGIKIADTIKKLPFQILSLIVLSVFTVYIITETAQNERIMLDYNFEAMYNAVIMCLMCLSLINYMTKDDRKSMNLLIGCICIVFSETLQLAFYYISNENTINLLCSLFFVAAFLFYYLQAKLLPKQLDAFEKHQGLNT